MFRFADVVPLGPEHLHLGPGNLFQQYLKVQSLVITLALEAGGMEVPGGLILSFPVRAKPDAWERSRVMVSVTVCLLPNFSQVSPEIPAHPEYPPLSNHFFKCFFFLSR